MVRVYSTSSPYTEEARVSNKRARRPTFEKKEYPVLGQFPAVFFGFAKKEVRVLGAVGAVLDIPGGRAAVSDSLKIPVHISRVHRCLARARCENRHPAHTR